MMKSSLIAAALTAIWAGGLTFSPSAASAEGMRAEMSCGVDGYNCPRSHNSWYGSDGGLGRYCPPGYYPHSFPGGNGIRCEAPDTGSSGY